MSNSPGCAETFYEWRAEMLTELRAYLIEHKADPEQALAQLPTDLDRLIRHGHFSCIRDLVDKAIRSLKEALRFDPTSYDANCALGRIYMGQGHYSLAEKYFKNALEINASNFKDMMSLLYVMKMQGACDEQVVNLQTLISKSMESALKVYSIESNNLGVFEILGEKNNEWINSFSPDIEKEFNKNKVAVIDNVLPQIIFDLILAQQNDARERKLLIHDERRSRYVSFDYLSAAVLANFQLCKLVKQIVGKDVIPTYAFSIHYVDGGKVEPHRDRLQNELSMSLSLGVNPDGMKWPLYAGDKLKERAINLRLNDALLYRGPEVTHFRKPLKKGRSCDQIIFGFRTVNESYCNCV